jgi:hypothetical protein
MRSSPRPFVLLACLFATACASAEKRLEQGMELQMQGRFDQAVVRYVEALEKDPNLQEARDRLVEVGDSAISRHLRELDRWNAAGDQVRAVSHVNAIDGLLARARTVGVRLPIPSDYTQRRMATFEGAVEGYLQEGAAARDRGRWQDAISAFRQARRFEPTAEQRDRSFSGEAGSLVEWAADELDRGRLRRAYEVAGEVAAVQGAPRELSLEAEGIMEEALYRGQVEVMPLPVVVGGRSPVPPLLDLEVRVNDLLAQGPWRAPPPFIRVTDDAQVRQVVREATALGAGLRAPALGLLLRLVEADYGAWLELVSLDATEFDVDQSTRSVRTRDGRQTAYVLERGTRRLRVEARVLVVDRSGNPLTDVVVVGTGEGPFERGLYEGDPGDLNLDRREVDHFDRLVLEAQESAILQVLAGDLSAQLAAAVFDPVLGRID